MEYKSELVLIGDSLTFGYGVPKKSSWTYKIQDSHKNLRILNKGINGDTSTGILSRFFKDIILSKPRKTFIMCGTNDLLSKRSVSSITSNIELMIKDCLSISSKIYIGIPPCIIKNLAEELFMPSDYYTYTTENLPILREKLFKLKEKYPITLIDFYSLTKSNLNNKIFLDGIHLNDVGNNLLFIEACKILF